MCGELNRYYIELQPVDGEPAPRYRETELRRALAAQFLAKAGAWLREQELIDKVSAMVITALGQVQITCEADVISHIRSEDTLNIAAIRQSGMYQEQPSRWNEAQ